MSRIVGRCCLFDYFSGVVTGLGEITVGGFVPLTSFELCPRTCLLLSGFCSYTIGYSFWVESGPYLHSEHLVYYWKNAWGLEEAGY